MFWEWLYGDDGPHGLCEDKATNLAYLVRCDYFRFTVHRPDALRKCEGYQAKGERHTPAGTMDPAL